MTLRSSIVPFVALFASFAATSAHAQEACSKDTDCKGVNVCEGGRCVVPGKAPPPPSETPATASAPVLTQEPTVPATAAPAALEPPAAPKPHVWRSRLSAYYIINPGVAGDARNDLGVGSSFGVELSIPLPARLRYRPLFGFQTAASLNGLRIDPLALGMTFDIPMASPDVHLAIEPAVSLFQAETFIDVGGSGNAVVFFSSGFDVALAMQTGPVVVAIAPVGADFRYLAWAPSNGNTSADFGMNWRGRITVGFEL